MASDPEHFGPAKDYSLITNYSAFTRRAVLDIGTNSVKLLIADVSAGAPVQVQGIDLHKFVGFVNIYLRGIAAAEVESYMEDSPDETIINLIKYGDLT